MHMRCKYSPFSMLPTLTVQARKHRMTFETEQNNKLKLDARERKRWTQHLSDKKKTKLATLDT